MLREFFHVTCAGRPLCSGSFGHRTLVRARGNDQRSLASVGEYGTGAVSSKSGPTGPPRSFCVQASGAVYRPQEAVLVLLPDTVPGPPAFISSVKSLVSAAGGASAATFTP